MGKTQERHSIRRLKFDMSRPISINKAPRPIDSGLSAEICGSPLEVARQGVAPPQFTTRRTRTISATARADEAELIDGTILAFSRTKGHGFLKSDSGDDKKEFFHVSDVTGQVVPQEGDKVKFRVIPIPPKYEKTQAVQVTVQNEDQLLANGRQTWAQSNEELKSSASCPRTPPPTPI